MTRFWGTGSSEGIAIAKVLKKEPLVRSSAPQAVPNSAGEVEKLNNAVQQLLKRMRGAYQSALKKSEAEAELYETYIFILEDNYFFDSIRTPIHAKHLTAIQAVEAARAEAKEAFHSLEDPYMRERFSDINSVCDDLVLILEGLSDSLSEAILTEPVVVVADSLTPLSTVHLNKQFLAGIVTKEGTPASHAAILARTLGIPAIVGVGETFEAVRTGDLIAISGYSGEVVLNPDAETLTDFQQRQEKETGCRRLYAAEPMGKTVTPDGRHISMLVNTGADDSASILDPSHCDGIGLLRTEYLYMRHADYPDEETQYLAYRNVVESMKGKPVTIRTLDIGGDKQLDYFGIPPEENPFLGFRAIRICINRPEIFKTQLRAILRSSAFGRVKVMFPMIVAMEELVAAKQFLEECKEELRYKKACFDENIEVGMMVETPAAALLSDAFATQVDFFSIGTNDLVQYLTATDRANPSVSYLYNNLNIAVLKVLQLVGNAAQNAGIPLAVCGEMATCEEIIPFLIGCGVNELSVPAPLVDKVRYIARRVPYLAARQLAARVVECSDIALAKQMLQKSMVSPLNCSS